METNFSQALLDPEVKQKIHDLSESIASEVAKEAPPDPLNPKERLQIQVQTDVEKSLIAYFESIAVGAKELMNALNALKEAEPTLFTENFDAQLLQLREQMANIGENPTQSPRECCGISDETMQIFHQAAAHVNHSEDYDKAAAVYSFLTYLDPDVPAYWIGYGNAHYFLKNFEQALTAYEKAIELAPQVPELYCYAAHCHSEMGKVDKALDLLDQMPEQKEKNQQVEDLKQYFKEH